jgi:alpha-mannosidase
MGCLLHVNSENVVVSTIRGSKDGKGLILRLQETGGYQGDIRIDFGENRLEEIIETDHLERPKKQLSICSGNKIEITLKPWEVATYKFILK